MELFDHGSDGIQRASGRDFQVQLKGTRAHTGTDTHVTFRIDASDLSHYLDNKRLPVFLVVIDVTTREGWWLFLQQHAAEDLEPGWRSQSTVTVRLPRSQSLAAEGAFRCAVVEAVIWMSNRWPGSPQAAVAAEAARLETLDARSTYEVSVKPGTTTVTVRPKSDFDLRFVVTGPVDARKAFHDELGFGAFVDPMAMGVALKLEDYPIAQGKTLAGVRFGGVREVTVSLLRERDGTTSVIEMPGVFTVGPYGTKGTVRVGRDLLTLGLTLDFRTGTARPMAADWSFCSREWHGKDALGPLNEFERLDRVFGGVRPSDRFAIELWWDGNRLIAGYMPEDFMAKVCKGVGYVEVVRRMRQLFGPLQRPILVPSSMSELEARSLERIWMLRNGVSVRDEVADIHFVLEAPRDRIAELIRLHGCRTNLLVPRDHLELPIWDHTFDVGPLLVELENASLKVESVFDLTDQQQVTAVVGLAQPCMATLHPFVDHKTLQEQLDRVVHKTG